MELKIGVQNVAREIVLDSEETAEAIAAALQQSEETGLLVLRDSKGGTVMIPARAIGYVEVTESTKGKVGFAVSGS